MHEARALHGRELHGRELRYRLTLLLRDASRPMTVRDLVARFECADVMIAGRPSKTISDALRWEIRRGRVRRTARSTYATGRIPRSTVWFIRRWIDDREVTSAGTTVRTTVQRDG